MKRLILGILAIVSAFLIFIFLKASAQGLDGLYWMRWSAGVMACAVPVFLLALAGALIIISSQAHQFSRKDKKK